MTTSSDIHICIQFPRYAMAIARLRTLGNRRSCSGKGGEESKKKAVLDLYEKYHQGEQT